MFLGASYLEWSAVLTTALCIFLAGRNNIHTWWTGIVACILYGALFYQNQLYADATLQVFFVATGIIGWVAWIKKAKLSKTDVDRNGDGELPITKTSRETLATMVAVAILVAVGYSLLLRKYTDAYAPGIDSLVLTFSVVAQLLLMRRKIENWPVWLLVNTLSVPLYFSRELYLSAVLYSFCWVNALVAWKHWMNLRDAQTSASLPGLSVDRE